MAKKGTCPSCYYEIELSGDVILGEIVECPDCASELEVVKIEGSELTMNLAEEVEDDWGE